MIRIKRYMIWITMVMSLMLCGCNIDSDALVDFVNSIEIDETVDDYEIIETQEEIQDACVSVSNIPSYSGQPYITINGDIPFFKDDELVSDSFEYYSDLDELGRCQAAYANIGTDLMPTEKRGQISQVKPTGWQTTKYDCVNGKYLYNRCHLIGYQLTAENANEKNLITGTRYLNVDGMLPFENLVADYIKETKNHVLYRVTPIFTGNNLVADGVLMEAESVEDHGDGVEFCVFIYNVQPGIEIDYATGDSQLANSDKNIENTKFILNTKTLKFHIPSCESANDISSSNMEYFTGKRDTLIENGYSPCKRCDP